MTIERDTSKRPEEHDSEHIKDGSVRKDEKDEIGAPGDTETGTNDEPPGYSGGRRRPLDDELDFDTFQNWGAE
jgi:hypothetical protein